MPCPACGQRQDLAVWLDQPGRAWLGERRVRATCCGCTTDVLLELHEGTMAIGPLRITQPGLALEASPSGLVVRLGGRSWFLARLREDALAKQASRP
ncbi:MAG: hypothetical protein JRH01_19365 [Deltaproteobacteria bacterium]|nr:hypothetical protein [Deltaproteobacteria bacterium]MBW2396754.1 hypothetical protein [Deltaproteobacteria bacterium]